MYPPTQYDGGGHVPLPLFCAEKSPENFGASVGGGELSDFYRSLAVVSLISFQ